MKKERFLSALSLTLLLTSLSAVAQVQQSVDPIAEVTAAGWMSAYPDGKFHGDVVLSRAELASILVKAFQLDRRQALAEPIQLQDVPKTHWAYNDIQTVLRNGIMAGYREGRFFPEQRVTRAEAFSIIAQAHGVFQFPEDTVSQILSAYPDAAEIPVWARKSMATALYEGFVNLQADQQIAPLAPMTRQDVAHALSVYLRRQQAPADLPWPASPL
ncbi:S-layer homology domain-containing protein [Leptolyngbya sp. NK1-12]|uniref:S-layer homology domain-containing protein n=1 Tax=Leptolyngbya sp. NK1-12 TaxID=2547451 RepID=A0AA96WCU1_9CYAN|nr:S-layer homology domain-containing protein [Leptolyngbya sp. NK1-12]WNZ22868.1 S-layer homology domain-containing protein [Leptolyngbya sp. NK1-12]